MESQSSKMMAGVGTAPNGGPRVWLESVSPGMRTVEAVLRELSQNDVPVLVVAEHGAGKAAAAGRIHSLSRRAADPFQSYLGRDVDERTLAGCEAQGGTIYLQEVSDLSAAAQKELVRQIGDSEGCARPPVHLWYVVRTGTRSKERKSPRRPLLSDQWRVFAAAAIAAAKGRYSGPARLVSLSRCS